jgi:dTDP-glucose pyrophosphorylase
MNIDKFLILENSTIKEALKRIDKGAKKVIFVVNEKNRLVGSITDGDIRRWILKTGRINGHVEQIYNSQPFKVTEDFLKGEVKKIVLEKLIEAIPVVDKNNRIIDILFWEQLFSDKIEKKVANLNIPVVIMAGGKGTRLDPFTKIMPKPLIPIGEKPIIEIIMDKFAEFGMNKFFISVNYKAQMIKAYFEDQQSRYNLSFILENKPLGTGGSLKLIKNKITSSFFVSNCDVIINDDYTKIIDFHKKGQYKLTLVASIQHQIIPYGVCEIEKGGKLKRIIEKPEYDFLVNTGVYMIEPEILDLIPDDTLFHITDLMEKLKRNNLKIGVFPISEKSWIDIGQWEEYRKALKALES